MKLRIGDTIDCTCTAGGWSRELNSRFENDGGGRWDGGGRCFPGQIQGKKTGRASEWMASNLFHPFVGAARAACANLPLFRPSVHFPLSSWLPLQILPSCTRLTPEHNGPPISFSPGLTFLCLNTDIPNLYVFCLHDFPSIFLSARTSRSHGSRWIIGY